MPSHNAISLYEVHGSGAPLSQSRFLDGDLRKPVFNSKHFHVEFMFVKVALGHLFRVLRSSLSVTFRHFSTKFIRLPPTVFSLSN